jgi:peptidoglycan-N-acetylglucosamine deacetylase
VPESGWRDARWPSRRLPMMLCLVMLALLLVGSGSCAGVSGPPAGAALAAENSVTPILESATTEATLTNSATSAPIASTTPSPVPTAAPSATSTIPAVRSPSAPTGTSTPPATATPRRLAPGVTPAPFYGGITTSGNPRTNFVALTFDSDSSDVGKLSQMLDTLKQYDMKATFFLMGIWADRNPQWVSRLFDEGHEVGTHSFSHPDFTKLTDAQMLVELKKSEQSIERGSGGRKMPRLLRPPFGSANRHTLDVATGQGYETLKWNVDPEDWRDSTPIGYIIRVVGQKTKPGDIVVMHLHVPKTADALPAILESFRARGVRSGTISQVLGRQP